MGSFRPRVHVSPGEEGLVMFDGVQLVRGGVAALARELPLGVVGARAARDVDVTAAEVTASFEGRRGRRNAIYDNTWREKVRVLKEQHQTEK